ncbi:PDDEXK nuclease domain-containing protein [Chryseobacterium wangxinyae]|uniref:PDDEXK nuclease domain-containing protein n=1 Tax=Chryseobacterium sp. CY350 TaxID=2997336 RepID=UPI00227188E4|nr:PDDEXK nuclease domain-containing protein [Chryseobacterium sp. CY350]MCY0976314.1 PDDEXK nuclease domain-containing protein [Chryseobacterium sp. CY350]WBZ94088.1 PDDEXK nuclease domain-containing protein [Chryseobacterium sp. CY350]
MSNLQSKELLQNISALLENARKKVVVAVNHTMVLTYFEIGRMIVEDEQNGENRAEYGKALLKDLSVHLTEKFGKGFSEDNLSNMRNFYISYSDKSISETASRKLIEEKSETLSRISENQISSTPLTNLKISQTLSVNFNLSWSHYLKLMRIKDLNERKFYEIESFKNNWSLRELQRQYDSALYSRLSISKNKEEILQLSEKGQIFEKPKDLIKDPYILEFLGLPEQSSYSENDLESGLIDKLEHFLLELGTGFTFVARQKRITFDEKHFKIDLVFYNRILKCFVLIDLKIGELKHQDIGQMQMYVNFYDREVKLEDENKTIGIVLCQDKSEALVRYTLPEENEQIFASKYLTVLPSKEDFIKILEEN